MHILAVRTLVLILLYTLMVSRSSIIDSRSYHRVSKTNVDTSPSSISEHNVTVNCGSLSFRTKTVWQCQRDLYGLLLYGYPWSPHGSNRNSRHNPNVRGINNTLRDALDSLRHVCRIHDRSKACLEESGIRDYCLATTTNRYILMDFQFQFICHHKRPSENLAHSLQCLQETRVLEMLFFHIAERCRGYGILDDIMNRYKKAYLYALNIKPFHDRLAIPILYCVPKSVIYSCIRDIVEDVCGINTADFVQDFLVSFQGWFDEALKSGGLNSNICSHGIKFDMMPNGPFIPSNHAQLGFSRLLEITAPGTALDTVWGKYLLGYLEKLSGKELCTTRNAYYAYNACVLSSDDKSETSKFNILQFAHGILLPTIYHGTQCSRLEQFTACWKLLQKICGPKTRGMEQHATLLVEGCYIQSEMDTAECHWQDMLLRHYIHASHVTLWPTGGRCLEDPMILEDRHLSILNIMDNMDTVISLLRPAVQEISNKCASEPAKRLGLLLNKLHYLHRDAFKYTYLYLHSYMPP